MPQLHHIALGARDVERVVTFYRLDAPIRPLDDDRVAAQLGAMLITATS